MANNFDLPKDQLYERENIELTEVIDGLEKFCVNGEGNGEIEIFP